MLGRTQEAADFLSRARTPPAHESPRGRASFEPEVKPLNVQSTESSPSAQRRETGSPRRSGPSPSASPPPVAEGITVSPTLLKELSGGQKVEFIDFVKVGKMLCVCRIEPFFSLDFFLEVVSPPPTHPLLNLRGCT